MNFSILMLLPDWNIISDLIETRFSVKRTPTQQTIKVKVAGISAAVDEIWNNELINILTFSLMSKEERKTKIV